MPFAGTLINFACIVVFSLLGSAIKHGIPEKLNRALLSAVAICVIYLGIDGALERPGADVHLPDIIFNEGITTFVVLMVSMTLGTLIGEIIDIDKHVNRIGAKLEKKLSNIGKRHADGEDVPQENNNFSRGFVSCTIMTCVGAMAVNGAILDAQGDPEILIAKSVIDAIACFIMAASFGVGCAFSAVPMLLYQGIITLVALIFSAVIPAASIYYLSVVGSLIIVLIGTNFIGATNVKTANMTPAVFLPLIITPILNLF